MAKNTSQAAKLLKASKVVGSGKNADPVKSGKLAAAAAREAIREMGRAARAND